MHSILRNFWNSYGYKKQKSRQKELPGNKIAGQSPPLLDYVTWKDLNVSGNVRAWDLSLVSSSASVWVLYSVSLNTWLKPRLFTFFIYTQSSSWGRNEASLLSIQLKNPMHFLDPSDQPLCPVLKQTHMLAARLDNPLR